MPMETTIFDPIEHLDTEGHAELIADAFATGDAHYIKYALNIVARARGMTQVAHEAGVTGEALYKALGPEGDPQLTTLLGVCNALGVKLSATSKAA